MKIILKYFLFLLLINIHLYGQNANVANLSKYTYLVLQYANNAVNSGNASCFFIRKSKRIYLVTCYHVITGFDSWSNRYEGPYDSIKIRYSDKKGRNNFFKIKINSSGFNFKNFTVDPDLFIYDVTDQIPKDAVIYSIEKFLRPRNRPCDTRELVSYQFSRSADDEIARQVQSIMANGNNFTWNEYSINLSPKILDRFSLHEPYSQKCENKYLDEESVFNLNPGYISSLTLTKADTNLYKYENLITKNANSQLQFNITNYTDSSKQYPNILKYTKSDFNDSVPLPYLGLTGQQNISQDLMNYGKLLINHDSSPPVTLLMIDTSSLSSNDGKKMSNIFKNVPPSDLIFTDTNYKYLNLNEPAENLFPLTIDSNKDTSKSILNAPNFFIGNPNYMSQIDSSSQYLLSLQKNRDFSDNWDSVFNIKDFTLLGDSTIIGWKQDLYPSDSLIYLKYAIPDLYSKPVNLLRLNPVNNVSYRDLVAKIDYTSFPPVFYTASIVNDSEFPEFQPKFYNNYYFTKPPSALGGSGSPLFFLCRSTINGHGKEWIQFAGMQCANVNGAIFLGQNIPLATIILKPEVIIQESTLLK